MKNLIRQNFFKKRLLLNKDYIDKKSTIIWNKIFDLKIYKACKQIFIYLPFKNELNSFLFIKKALKDNKKIGVPILQDNNMIFSALTNFENLKQNKYKILEPSVINKLSCDKNTIIIIPALAYSKNKYRIGYGGGYYDRFLCQNTCMKTIGVCLDKFIIDSFDIDKFDIAVDIIVTESDMF